MKIILLQDVAKVGKHGALVDVASGYGSFLISQHKAQLATQTAVETFTKQQAKKSKDALIKKNELEYLIHSLQGVTILYAAKTNEQGHLFAALHCKDIVQILKEKHNVAISEKMITLENPIKEIGDHSVVVSGGKERVKLTLHVESA